METTRVNEGFQLQTSRKAAKRQALLSSKKKDNKNQPPPCLISKKLKRWMKTLLEVQEFEVLRHILVKQDSQMNEL